MRNPHGPKTTSGKSLMIVSADRIRYKLWTCVCGREHEWMRPSETNVTNHHRHRDRMEINKFVSGCGTFRVELIWSLKHRNQSNRHKFIAFVCECQQITLSSREPQLVATNSKKPENSWAELINGRNDKLMQINIR